MISTVEKRREYYRIKAKEWRKNNPEKVYAINHSEANKVRQARYRASHKHIDRKPYMAAYNKAYYQKNKEKEINRVRQYAKNNPETVKETRRKNWLKIGGYKKGTNGRLALDIRRRIGIALKKGYKTSSVEVLLGATISELKIHLEKQFQVGMSWENHTLLGWHIDHIIPLSSFDLSKEEEQRKAFHYTNLQPLWSTDNLRKSNRMIV